MLESKIFNPQEDSIFGKILFSSTDNKEELSQVLKKWIIPQEHFFFSSGIQKQYYLSNLPDQIRKKINENNLAINEEILLPLKEQNCLDISLELMEWFLIAYQKRESFISILEELCHKEISFQKNFWEKLNFNYEQFMKKGTI